MSLNRVVLVGQATGPALAGYSEAPPLPGDFEAKWRALRHAAGIAYARQQLGFAR